jgi:PKD repeat protein
MNNGYDLNGDPSATQSGIIVPWPGNDTLYYIFTADSYENTGSKGYNYSIVNINGADGLGEVTKKNINLYIPSTEKITVAKHSNGINWWLITKEKVSGKFRTYLITEKGINVGNPVVSDGAANPFLDNAVTGMLHISPDNSRLALASEFLGLIEIFKFDNNSGKISDKVSISQPGPYGIEFSPNSRFLYASAYQISKIWQYDLIDYSQTAIANSETIIKEYSFEYPFGLQLGPDKKIYISKNQTFLDVIMEPDNKGDSCKLITNHVDLKGRNSNLMLTNMVPSLITPVITTINVTYVDYCKRIVKFDCVNNFSANTSFKWKFENLDSSDLKNPQYTFPFDKDSFNIKLVTETSIKDENGGIKVVTLENFATVGFDTYPAAKFSNNNDCGNRNIVFIDSSSNRSGGVATWFWIFGDGATSKEQSPVYEYPAFGTYNLKMVAVSKNGCPSDTVYKTLIVADKPIADFETFAPCIQQSNLIKNRSSITSPDSITGYQWDFGDGTISNLSEPEKSYDIPGSFTVKLVCTGSSGCTSDTVSKLINVEDFPVAGFKEMLGGCRYCRSIN